MGIGACERVQSLEVVVVGLHAEYHNVGIMRALRGTLIDSSHVDWGEAERTLGGTARRCGDFAHKESTTHNLSSCVVQNGLKLEAPAQCPEC